MSALACPECGKTRNTCIDSRPTHAGRTVRRRRRCEGCQHAWTTYEISAGNLRGFRGLGTDVDHALALLPDLVVTMTRLSAIAAQIDDFVPDEPS